MWGFPRQSRNSRAIQRPCMRFSRKSACTAMFRPFPFSAEILIFVRTKVQTRSGNRRFLKRTIHEGDARHHPCSRMFLNIARASIAGLPSFPLSAFELIRRLDIVKPVRPQTGSTQMLVQRSKPQLWLPSKLLLCGPGRGLAEGRVQKLELLLPFAVRDSRGSTRPRSKVCFAACGLGLRARIARLGKLRIAASFTHEALAQLRQYEWGARSMLSKLRLEHRKCSV